MLKLFSQDRREAILRLNRENVNEKYASGWTLTHQVARDGDLETLLLLIELGADVWTKDRNDLTPLQIAIIESNVDIVRVLVSDEVFAKLDRVKENDACAYIEQSIMHFSYRISELVFTRFVPLITARNVTRLVRMALEKCSVSFEFFRDVLGKLPECDRVIRQSDTMSIVIYYRVKCPSYTTFIDWLFTEKCKYVFDIANLQCYMIRNLVTGSELSALKVLLFKHRDKVRNLNHPNVLAYAIETQNLDAVDLLLAAGCDPHARAAPTSITPGSTSQYDVPCLYMALDYHINHPSREKRVDEDIVNRILLYSGSFRDDCLPLTPFTSRFRNRVDAFAIVWRMGQKIASFYKEVTLFDILYYRMHIQELRDAMPKERLAGRKRNKRG